MTTKYTKNFGLALPDFRQGPWHNLINDDFTTLDTLLFTALSAANVAVWVHAHDYHIGDNALDDTDATIWLCVIAHKSAASGTFAEDRAAHPTYWTRLLTGFAPRGEWVQSTNYFPYDLAYDSARGIMALCQVRHTSTSTGSIIDDKVNWVFLLDMSDVGTVTAMSVSYSNSASHIPKTNVQDAVDYVETQIKGLDNVNIAQGNQITAIQNVNTAQDNRLTAVEGKDTSVAGHFTATDNVSTQFGGSAALGYYMDASNAAIRPPGNGTVYFQSQGGAITYGTIGNGSASFHGALNAAGGINAATVNATSGALYVSGWSGNPNISVIFLNAAQNHYMYHDANGNVTFSGVPAVHAANGRLWGSNDSLPIPTNFVTNGRLAFAGDNAGPANSMHEPYGGAVVTGMQFNVFPDSRVGFVYGRYRYLQLLTTSWFTVGYV
jgi:hypothetical protein